MSTLHSLAAATPAGAMTTKPPMLCLHASGSSARQWQAMTPALAARWRAVSPDLLGYGDAARWPLGTPVSLDDEAQALAPLLHREPVHLFGHSYGGAVALQMALRWPERVRSLTLYEPVRFALLFDAGGTARAAGESIAAVGRRIGWETLSGRSEAAAQRFVDYWSGDGAWQQLGNARRQAVAERMPKVQAEFEALFADPVPASAYARLAMPVRLIGGTRSPLPARQVLEVLRTSLPHVTCTMLEGLGHLGPIEAPQRVLAGLGVDGGEGRLAA